MDALIDEIVAKTEMTRDMAERAARASVDFLKSRLPSSVGSQIDGVLFGEQVRATGEQIKGTIEGTFRR